MIVWSVVEAGIEGSATDVSAIVVGTTTKVGSYVSGGFDATGVQWPRN